jgi:hypothetical protein
LYYRGSFHPYLPFGEPRHERLPIYVGKAVRGGSRKGFRFDPPQKHEISDRLKNHEQSITSCKNLEVSDFHCRYLCVEDSFIGLAESILISVFDPLWNRVLDGFGNNPTGKRRAGQNLSKWDKFHPGRVRGGGASKYSTEQLVEHIAEYFSADDGQSDERLANLRHRIEKYGLA